ncbi:MAG: hypothetical protein HOV76_32395 [Hamadaea sp.]|nr:hypothetical protein [Catenulispora sp.]NUT08178.1 hypothetical protein [Hamadaea sp.]
MGLRDQIEAKQRRTAKVPILIGNPSAAAAEVTTFQVALAAHLSEMDGKRRAGRKATKADQEREKKLRADLEEAVQRQSAQVVDVEVQSLPEDEWEAALASLSEEARDAYELNDILAALLAASCTDPELQDADWWAEQLKKPTWTDGDKSAISRTMLELNVLVPRLAALGKG